MSTIDTQALIESITAQVTSAVLAALSGEVETPAAQEAKPAPVKTEPRYRTKAQVAKGHAAEQEIYARYRATTGKGFKAMTAKQQAACKAEVRAVWSALEGTCKTKRV